MTTLLLPVQLGQYANDGTGDDLRTAFTRVNNSFAAITSQVNITGATNLGSGAGLFADVNLNNLEFKTLTSTNNSIAITSTANTVNLSSTTNLSLDTNPRLGADLGLQGHRIFGPGDVQSTIYGINVPLMNAIDAIVIESNLINVDFGGFSSPTGFETDLRGYTVDMGLFTDTPINNKINFGNFVSTTGSIYPIASTSSPGVVQLDGTSIAISAGIISAVPKNITDVIGNMLVTGTNNGIVFTYNAITGGLTTTVLGGAGGGGGLSGITVQQGGVIQGSVSAVATLNFTGSGVSATVSGSQSNINIPGYTLPTASTVLSGGVKIDGSTITINGSGVISSTVPTATTTVLGAVKVDGTSITVNAGIISATPYSLPSASTSVLGGVKIDGATITVNPSGQLQANFTPYTLPIATTSALGGVIIDGTTITINGSGVISSSAAYSLPVATTSVLGGVKVDNTSISISGGVISTVASNIQSVAAGMLTGGAQTGITFTYNAGNGTITSTVTGGSGGSGITGVSVQDEGITQGITGAVTTFNFTGSAVTAGVAGNTATVNISATNYILPQASTTVLGGVKVDGSTITASGAGVISAVAY